jgi:hypothetical protein
MMSGGGVHGLDPLFEMNLTNRYETSCRVMYFPFPKWVWITARKYARQVYLSHRSHGNSVVTPVLRNAGALLSFQI